MRTTTAVAAMATAMLAGACSSAERADEQPGGDTAEAPGMPGMAGMQGMAMQSTPLMAGMRQHLDSLAAAPRDVLRGLLVAHETMASRLLDAMGADMTAMGMSADAGWTALTDSVRLDLADFPGLTGPALADRVRGHVARFRRLLDDHERMMAPR
jgi:hypothetical protein